MGSLFDSDGDRHFRGGAQYVDRSATARLTLVWEAQLLRALALVAGQDPEIWVSIRREGDILVPYAVEPPPFVRAGLRREYNPGMFEVSGFTVWDYADKGRVAVHCLTGHLPSEAEAEAILTRLSPA